MPTGVGERVPQVPVIVCGSVRVILFGATGMVGQGALRECLLDPRVEQVLARYGTLLRDQPRAIPFQLSVLSAYHAGGTQIVIVGGRDGEDARALHRVVAASYQPFAIVVPVEPGPAQQALATLLPFVASMHTVDGAAAAYVCRSFACDTPVTEPEDLKALLARRSN